MFKEMIESRRRSALVFDALQEVLDMLNHAERMFAVTAHTLLTDEEVVGDVDREDREINTGERMVRRMILEHLTLNPDQDLPASLALISIVHEVERIGDYAKHLVELSQWSGLCSGESPYGSQCREIHAMIAPLFGQVQKAMQESDAEAARQVMRRHVEIKERTDVFMGAIMEDAESNREAVLYTLASRYLRRISAHLSNVASCVANPLDRVSGKEA